MFKYIASAAALISLVAAAPKPAAHHASQPSHRLIIVRMDSDFRPHKRSEFGRFLGYDPVEIHARMGDKIQFVNPDDENHTATGLTYSGQHMPSNYKLQGDFTKQHGRIIDASEWSTGTVRAHGGKSQVFVTKRPGHYFFECGYHVSEGMAGMIVVEP